MPKSCCVYGCGNKYIKQRDQVINSGVIYRSFYRFPTKCPELTAQWIEAVKNKNPNWPLPRQPFVCCDHFIDSDFIACHDYNRLRQDIKVVPSIFKDVEQPTVQTPEVVDISGMCRLCGVSTELFGVSLLDPARKQFTDEATQLFNLEINASNGFPTTMCPECVKKIEDLILLKETCLKTHQNFCHLLGVSNNSIINSDINTREIESKEVTPTRLCDTDNKLLNVGASSSVNIPSEVTSASIIVDPQDKKTKKCQKRKPRSVSTKLKVKKNLSQCESPISEPNLGQFVLETPLQICPKTEPISDEDSPEEVNNKPKIICHICMKVFARQCSLKRHMVLHEEAKLICNYCSKKYHLLMSLRKHIKVHHSLSKDQKLKRTCPECKKVLSSPDHLKQHMFRHKEPKVVCSHCKKKYYTVHSLKEHLKTHHKESGVIMYQCMKCSKQFLHKTNLRTHESNVHNMHSCKECGVYFESQVLLFHHMILNKDKQCKNKMGIFEHVSIKEEVDDS